MLAFFRKYQRYFFLITTFVIVISFSFFGTYNSLPQAAPGEQVAFIAADGSAISRQELDEMTAFLATDSSDKLLMGGVWGANFLNDGVLTKDFLQTGLATLLIQQFPKELAPVLQSRLAKEKLYTPYVHPQASYISVENAWAYFAPEMKSSLRTLKQANDPLADDALAAKVQLYLSEKQFPAPLVQQVLTYQLRQQPTVPRDPQLDRYDFSLFGYHLVEDWFSPQFVELAAQYVINSAKVAQQRGYIVTKAEAIADLQRNADISFQANQQSPYLSVTSSQEYLAEQLRRMHMDQNRAAKLWQQVLLFRRLLGDAASSAFVDPIAFTDFTQHAKEPFAAEIYQLPTDLQLGNYRALQKFEFYVDAIGKRSNAEIAALALPQTFTAPDEMARKFPELVQKRYRLQVQAADKDALLTKVGLKEMWGWEVLDSSWVDLKKEFPELGLKKAQSREERFAALDSLDEQTRRRLDSYARRQIVDLHPEWLAEALEQAPSHTSMAAIPLKGKSPFKGLADTAPLIALLDAAPIGLQEASTATPSTLNQYSGDGRHYYKIAVIERMPTAEVMTFAAANRLGALDLLLDKVLEERYMAIREAHPELFKKNSGNWAPFGDVKDLVADFYFAPTLQAINSYVAKSDGKDKVAKLTGSQAAAQRLHPYVSGRLALMQLPTTDADSYVVAEPVANDEAKELTPAPSPDEQWKLHREKLDIDRSTAQSKLPVDALAALPIAGWSAVVDAPNGALYFYQRIAAAPSVADVAIREKTAQAYELLGNELQRHYGLQLIVQFKEKGAFFLADRHSAEEELIP
jgi:GcvH upstream region-like protein